MRDLPWTPVGLVDPLPPRSIEEQEQDAPPCWVACHFPERPMSSGGAFHDCCPACLIALKAAVAAGLVPPTYVDGTDAIAHTADRMERFGPAPRSAVTP